MARDQPSVPPRRLAPTYSLQGCRFLFSLFLFSQAAADAGCKQFVFVSVHDYKAPSVVKKVGYFDGKRRAEKAVGELFGEKVRAEGCPLTRTVKHGLRLHFLVHV